jgi:hypothetical protein
MNFAGYNLPVDVLIAGFVWQLRHCGQPIAEEREIQLS